MSNSFEYWDMQNNIGTFLNVILHQSLFLMPDFLLTRLYCLQSRSEINM
jgi:hypothetical protein